jgi:ribosomal protein L35AE/L33A
MMRSINVTATNVRILGLNPSRATTWHLSTVIIPRRTITGRLVRGQVWRRHDGRHWLYKKFMDGAAA